MRVRECQIVIRNTCSDESNQKRGVEEIKSQTEIIQLICQACDRTDINTIQDLINSLDISEQLGIHGYLRKIDLEFITINIDSLEINDGVKEHIVYSNLSRMNWSDKLLGEIVKIYKSYGFIAMESLVITAIKQDIITPTQLKLILLIFSGSKAIRKELTKKNLLKE